mmetsp:Transcript_62473/g.140889  ORF Transcript_62473/g.140889 Transcript_62473/m.140889 type:complete len:660 (+) Transcript_62473:3-1982(+)
MRSDTAMMVVPAPPVPSGVPVGKAVQVNACGRVLDISPAGLGSMSLLCRELADHLKMSGSVCLNLADVRGVPVQTDQELSAALEEGRHPFQATPTVAALREIEQKKYEVETRKEQMAQFQWQIITDQIAKFSEEVSAVAAQLQSVKEECRRTLQDFRAETDLQRDQMGAALEREVMAREASTKDLDIKLDKLAQVVNSERSVRDVADHQLGRQIEQVASSVDEERNVRMQEQREVSRVVDSMRHTLDAEMKRAAEIWNQHLDMVKRVDGRLEAQEASEFSQVERIQQLEAESDKLQGASASLEATMAAQHRALAEDIQHRSEELSKAVRDEMLGRENHITRFAKDLETSWQSMDARMQRVLQEATEAKATQMERSRVLEQRCAELEHSLGCHAEGRASKEQSLLEKVTAMCNMLDSMELGLKASDVVLHNTVSKVEDLSERQRAAEHDLQSKVSSDYWKPQIDAFLRSLQKHESKVAMLEKEMNTRFNLEGAQRDRAKAQIQDSMKACLDKFSPSKRENVADRRFIEVPEASTGLSPDPSSSVEIKSSVDLKPQVDIKSSVDIKRQGSAASVQVASVMLSGSVHVPGAHVMRQLSAAPAPGHASPRLALPPGAGAAVMVSPRLARGPAFATSRAHSPAPPQGAVVHSPAPPMHSREPVA